MIQLLDLHLPHLLHILPLQSLQNLLGLLPEVRGELEAVDVALAVSHHNDGVVLVEGDVVEASLLLVNNSLESIGGVSLSQRKH